MVVIDGVQYCDQEPLPPLEELMYHSTLDIVSRIPKREPMTFWQLLRFRLQTLWNAWVLCPTLPYFVMVIKWLADKGFFSKSFKRLKK